MTFFSGRVDGGFVPTPNGAGAYDDDDDGGGGDDDDVDAVMNASAVEVVDEQGPRGERKFYDARTGRQCPDPRLAPALARANQCWRSPHCVNGFKHRGSCSQPRM